MTPSVASGHRHVTAQEFLGAFRKQWETLKSLVSEEDIKKAYESDPEWTAWMLGHTRGKSPHKELPDKNGFLGKVGEVLKFGSEQIRREDYTVDCSYVSGTPLLAKDHWGYASHLSVLIEHENNLDSIQFEMWKLLFWRAPLKVIISYDRPELERRDAHNTRLANQLIKLRSMLEKTSSAYPESDGTEYLIIIGDRATSESMPRWRWTTDFSEPTPLEHRE